MFVATIEKRSVGNFSLCVFFGRKRTEEPLPETAEWL